MVDGPFFESLNPPAEEMSYLRGNHVGTTFLLPRFLQTFSVFGKKFPYFEVFFAQNHTKSHGFF